MLTLFFVVLLILMIIFTILYRRGHNEEFFLFAVIAGILASAFLIGVCYQSYQVFCRTNSLDVQIEMYEQENTKIENTIHTAVQNYMEHEKLTYKNMTHQDAIAILDSNIYPELNSSDLVKEEMATYKINNEKLIQLKEVRIVDISTARFLLYFGN